MPGRWALPLPMAPLTPTSTAGTWWIAAVVRLAQEAARLVPHSAALLLAWVASYVPSAPVLNCGLCLTVWHPGPGPPAEPFPLERIRFVSRWGVALMRQHRGRPVASPACPTAALNALVVDQSTRQLSMHPPLAAGWPGRVPTGLSWSARSRTTCVLSGRCDSQLWCADGGTAVHQRGSPTCGKRAGAKHAGKRMLNARCFPGLRKPVRGSYLQHGPFLPCPAAPAAQPAVYSFEQAVQHSGWEGFTVEFAWTPYPSHFVVEGMNGAAAAQVSCPRGHLAGWCPPQIQRLCDACLLLAMRPALAPASPHLWPAAAHRRQVSGSLALPTAGSAM